MNGGPVSTRARSVRRGAGEEADVVHEQRLVALGGEHVRDVHQVGPRREHLVVRPEQLQPLPEPFPLDQVGGLVEPASQLGEVVVGVGLQREQRLPGVEQLRRTRRPPCSARPCELDQSP